MTGGLSLAAFLTAYFAGKDHRQPGDAAAILFLWLLASPAAIRLALPLLPSPVKLAFVKDIIPLACSPALYFYARSCIPGGRRDRPVRLLHFLPFVIAVSILASPPWCSADGSPCRARTGLPPAPRGVALYGLALPALALRGRGYRAAPILGRAHPMRSSPARSVLYRRDNPFDSPWGLKKNLTRQ